MPGDEGSPDGANGLHVRAKRVFAAALEQTADLREAHVARTCGDDTDLYREVMSLLQNYADTGTFLDHPPVPIAAPPPESDVDVAVVYSKPTISEAITLKNMARAGTP